MDVKSQDLMVRKNANIKSAQNKRKKTEWKHLGYAAIFSLPEGANHTHLYICQLISGLVLKKLHHTISICLAVHAQLELQLSVDKKLLM